MNMTVEKTNWYIITGGPSTGKSKTIDHLAYLGYLIRPEVARILIDDEISKGRTLTQIRGNQKQFEEDILRLKIEVETKAPKEELIFWERGLPDSIVYLKDCGGDLNGVLEMTRKIRYRGIFILDLLPQYEKDYARTETSQEAKVIHEALYNCYMELGYKVIRVPVAPISERAQYIIKHIHKDN